MNRERLQLVITNPCNYNYYKGEKFAAQPTDLPYLGGIFVPLESIWGRIFVP